MKIHITGRHIRLTKAIREYIDRKLSKAEKHFSQIVWAQVLLSVEKRTHQAEIVLHAGHQTFRSMAKAADLYAAVDLASDKIDGQLRRYKERLKSRHKNAVPAPVAAAQAEEAQPVRFSVVKKVALVPMSADAAAREMERLGYAFWMFQDQDSRQVNVIFRRQDESFGLLQPAKP